MTELEQATIIANRWLDFKMNCLTQMVPGDPDCDACVLARQFLRALDRIRAIEAAVIGTMGGTVDGNPTSTINYLQRLRALVDIETMAKEAAACDASLNSLTHAQDKE